MGAFLITGWVFRGLRLNCHMAVMRQQLINGVGFVGDRRVCTSERPVDILRMSDHMSLTLFTNDGDNCWITRFATPTCCAATYRRVCLKWRCHGRKVSQTSCFALLLCIAATHIVLRTRGNHHQEQRHVTSTSNFAGKFSGIVGFRHARPAR